jgi:hypothetical protein
MVETIADELSEQLEAGYILNSIFGSGGSDWYYFYL